MSRKTKPGFTACLAAAGSFLFWGCGAPPVGGDSEGAVAASSGEISFGTPDTTHPGVVVVLSPAIQCSGAIVQVKPGGTAYVLTAAHCCAGPVSTVPTTIVVGQDAASPSATVYQVDVRSVYYDAGYAGTATPFDFCMLTFAGAGAGTQVLALPSASGDGLSIGAAVEHVGYGITAPPLNENNTRRFHGTDAADMPSIAGTVSFANQFTYSTAGPGNTPGTCPGDSGGPSLFPAGVSATSQIVVGVQSYGGPATANCGTYTFGGDSRVSSRIGTGKFISTYLADGSMTGIGIRAATPGVAVPAVPAAPLALLAALLVVLRAHLTPPRGRSNERARRAARARRILPGGARLGLEPPRGSEQTPS
jgi:hypothetical protein